MARKLNPEEANIFNDGNQPQNQSQTTDIETFLRKLGENQEEAFDVQLIPGFLLGQPLKRFG